jgi:hypothetical protein
LLWVSAYTGSKETTTERFRNSTRRYGYRQLLREEIAHTVMLPGDIEDELRHLIAVLEA